MQLIKCSNLAQKTNSVADQVKFLREANIKLSVQNKHLCDDRDSRQSGVRLCILLLIVSGQPNAVLMSPLDSLPHAFPARPEVSEHHLYRLMS